MRQQDYEILVKSINYGVPALASELITALNVIVDNSNRFLEDQRVKAEEARRAEIMSNSGDAKQPKQPKEK